MKIKGGLGNQLFQYALGRHLSLRNDEPLKLDLFPFETYKLHNYSLAYFNIAATPANKNEIKFFLPKRLKKIFLKLIPYYRRQFIDQRGSHFDANILHHANNAYLAGHWMSQKYFEDIESIIRKDITLAEPYRRELEQEHELLNAMRRTDSIAVHVRRGDYVRNPSTLHKFGVCSPEYYKKAEQYLASRLTQPHFFIFSDDIEWASENLKFNGPMTLVDHGVAKNYLDLMLMSSCKHAIIANSSFSWWGAWLIAHPGKMIVAPSKWLANSNKDLRDLVPEDWIRL